MRTLSSILASIVVAAMLVWPAEWHMAEAAEIRLEGNNADGVPVVSVKGDFVERDIERFADVTKDLDSAVIVFESDGGEIVAGIEIGTRIRLRGYQTVVDNDTDCFSACAIAWLGGTTRYVGRGAQVGFHAAYLVRDGRFQETGVGNAVVGAYASSLGLKTSAVIFMTSAPPEGFNRLSEDVSKTVGIAAEFGDVKGLLPLAAPEYVTGSPGGGLSGLFRPEGLSPVGPLRAILYEESTTSLVVSPVMV